MPNQRQSANKFRKKIFADCQIRHLPKSNDKARFPPARTHSTRRHPLVRKPGAAARRRDAPGHWPRRRQAARPRAARPPAARWQGAARPGSGDTCGSGASPSGGASLHSAAAARRARRGTAQARAPLGFTSSLFSPPLTVTAEHTDLRGPPLPLLMVTSSAWIYRLVASLLPPSPSPLPRLDARRHRSSA